MKSPKYINNYRLQYWLYAILNKRFGRLVHFNRDSLHSKYSVNRHGFDVTGEDPYIVMKELDLVLKSCGYVVKKMSENNNELRLTKIIMHEKCKEEMNVSLNVYNRQFGYNTGIYLQVLPAMYLYKLK